MIRIFTTGGTIDKIYFDANSEFSVGDSLVPEILADANVTPLWAVTELTRKDSLELTDDDRMAIVSAVSSCEETKVLITHGTDTMARTAEALQSVTGKTIVLLGAMRPARMRDSDAAFNLGYALAAVQLLPANVYLAMNGEVFEAGKVRKNLQAGRFEKAD